MRATVSCLASLVAVLALSGAAQADHPFCHGCGCPSPAYNAFTVCPNYWGAPYFGTNVICPPPMSPFNGMLPPPNWNGDGQGGQGMFATHPYARSPRDFFMLNLR